MTYSTMGHSSEHRTNRLESAAEVLRSINTAIAQLCNSFIHTKTEPVPLSARTSPDPGAAGQMGLAYARVTMLPARAAMDYHKSTVQGTAVCALIRPNLT